MFVSLIFGGFMRLLLSLLSVFLLVDSSFADSWATQQKTLSKMVKSNCGALELVLTPARANAQDAQQSFVIRTTGRTTLKETGGRDLKAFRAPVDKEQALALVRAAGVTAQELTTITAFVNSLDSEYPAKISVIVGKVSPTASLSAEVAIELLTSVSLPSDILTVKCLK